MSTSWLLGAALAAFSLAPWAIAQESYKLCKLVKDDADRLKCFDAATTLPAAPAPGLSENSGWKISESRGPLDDSPQYVAILPSNDNKSGLMLRCKEKQTEITVISESYLGTNSPMRVQYRIDEAPPITAGWSPSSNGRGVFAPTGTPIPLLAALPDKGKLFFRVYDFQSVAHDSLFTLDRISEIRGRISEACNWRSAATKGEAAASPLKMPVRSAPSKPN